ncbi:MAG TPA: sugar phosphate isomerase/epimerase [Anaerolineae bacterium]|jgi:sugar phosphate isomerase/epimerase|nr:sugar phosphate isomerase/epimerase [Anaerolineae bacterium]
MDAVKLACSSSAYTNIPLTDAIQRIASIGYSAIDIYAGHEFVGEGNPRKSNLERIKAALTEHNISVANIAVRENYPNISPMTENAISGGDTWTDHQHIERIKQYIRFAREVNCSSVSINPGRMIPGTLEVTPPAIIAALIETTKFARGLGVAVGITYGPGLILSRVNDVKPLLMKCRGLKIAFHVGNSHLACETPCNIAKEFKQYIKHIYVADIGNSDRPYLIPGDGEIEWLSFFKTLRWIGYQGFVAVDISSYRDTPDLAARRAFFYLSNIITGLKRPKLKDSA